MTRPPANGGSPTKTKSIPSAFETIANAVCRLPRTAWTIEFDGLFDRKGNTSMALRPERHRVERLYAHTANIPELETEFASLVEKALKSVGTGDPRPDTIFGDFAEFVSVARSVAFHEGKLLEWGISLVAKCNPDLLVLPPDRPMPIVPAAVELLSRNEWTEIQGIRLPSEVHTNKTYTPDIFIADRKRHSGLIVDVKRSLSSYAEGKLETLRFKMMAVAAIASSWLGERQGPVLVEVGTAIIDGSDEASNHDRGVWGLSEIDNLLEINGAGKAMVHLREMFAIRVQHELHRQCRKISAATCAATRETAHEGGPDPISIDSSLRVNRTDKPASFDRGPRLSNQTPPPFHQVRVGFARSRASP